MDTAITALGGLSGINTPKFSRIEGYADSILKAGSGEENLKTSTFDDLLSSAMDMITETNDYVNAASEAELSYALGITNSTHELQVAQMKAGISLQYTVAVRNAVIDAYKEIMTLQF